MLSLCIIAKPTNREAELLDRCLGYVSKYVDEICVTQAGEEPNKIVSKVIKKYKGKESFFKWIKDFAKARNFNFNQANGKYILWLDTDDIIKGAKKLPSLVETIEKNKIDVVAMQYLYDFDEQKRCTVKHLKSRLVRKDAVEWVGAVHEDLQSIREVVQYLCEDIEIMHLTDKNRVEDSKERNLEIALNEVKERPEDPRSYWLVANAYWGKGEITQAVINFKEFLKISGSDEEKYLANLILADLDRQEKYALDAISLRPTYPNAYHKIAEIKFEQGKYQTAINFIEIGLQLPTSETEMIVVNPRDYDYNPLMLMMKCYWKLGKNSQAVEIVKKLKDMFPDDEKVANYFKILEEEKGEALYAEKYLKEAEKIEDKKKLLVYLESLPEKVKQHPLICAFRNQNFIKEVSSGKDLVFYCSYTTKQWNPEIALKDGVGGSEEAVINLSRELVKLGWNVTVYNNCGEPKVYDGVSYKPFWEYNIRDKQDWTIFWRHPKPVDYEPNSKIAVDMHDVISANEFTEDRIRKIDKVFVKGNAHKSLFPNIEDKIVVIPNGINPKLFKKTKKNPYLILNTSSPDRHLDATLDIFEELIRRQPDKPWKLAWYYGWGVYDSVHENDAKMMKYKKDCMDRFEKLVKEGRAEGGYMINHEEIAKKYLEAGVFLYPTQFTEIHCISAVKAQLAGCNVITSDWAALSETVKFGTKIHTDGEKWINGEATFGDSKNKDKYIDVILQNKQVESKKMRDWAIKTYEWKVIAEKWHKELTNCS